jgi:hypothetical protein
MYDKITFKTKNRFKNSIRRVIKGLSRKVLVYKKPIRNECPNCYFDKLTGRSSGKCSWTIEEVEEKNDSTKYKWFSRGRCPICSGRGYLEVKRKVWVSCLITWEPNMRSSNVVTYTPAGAEGATIVQLKTDTQYHDLFSNCTNMIVDGIECKLSKPPILRGLGSQAVLVIAAFTTQKLDTDSDEIIKGYHG